MTTGERLRTARERLGMSQRVVAERLCLMLVTVREIEEDRLSPDLAPTFVRGYIRSYAKLVQLPEEDVQIMLAESEPSTVFNPAVLQNFSMSKKRKKRDGWLMMLTWLILLVVIGLTGAWWWQNHQAQKQEMVSMVEESGVQTPETMPLSESARSMAASGVQQATSTVLAGSTGSVGSTTSTTSTTASTEPLVAMQQQLAEQQNIQSGSTTELPQTMSDTPMLNSALPANTQLPLAPASVGKPLGASQLTIDLVADCWLEVQDANNKVLTSSLHKKGARLELDGKAPFKVKLGVPSAVRIQYQGNPVDLGSLVKSGQVARLTIPVQPIPVQP